MRTEGLRTFLDRRLALLRFVRYGLESPVTVLRNISFGCTKAWCVDKGIDLREFPPGVPWACVLRDLLFAYTLGLVPNDSSELELDSPAGDLARGWLILLALVDREYVRLGDVLILVSELTLLLALNSGDK
jgi:hypothetical protein